MELDSLEIKVQSSSQEAASGLDKLAASLGNLKSAAKGGAGLSTLAKGLERINASLSGTGLNGSKIQSLVSALSSLSQIQKASGLNSVVNSLKKLPDISSSLDKLDLDKFASQIQRVAAAMKPLASEMEKVSNGFKAFPVRIQKIIQSNNALTSSNAKATRSFSLLNKGINLYIFQRVASIMSGWVTSANEYIENVNLFQVSMGEFYDEAFAYAQLVGDRLGIDPSEWMRNQGVFMSMANGFGIAKDQAYALSEGLTELSYDLSSLYNEDMETSALRLQSALAGEIEPIRRLGIAISEASLKEFALSKGITKSVESMTEQEKALLRAMKLMEGAANIGAIGDFARTLESPANALRVLNQQITQFKRAIGSVMLPVLIQVIPYVQAFVELLTEAVSALATLVGFTMPTWDASDWGSDLSSGASSATDAVDDITEAVEKLKNATLGIDELNIISPPTNASSGGTGASMDWVSGLEIPDIWDKEELEALQSQVDALKKKLRPLLTLALEIGAAIASWKIGSAIVGGLKKVKGALDLVKVVFGAVFGAAALKSATAALAGFIAACMLQFNIAGGGLAGILSVIKLIGSTILTSPIAAILIMAAQFVNLLSTSEKFQTGLSRIAEIMQGAFTVVGDILGGVVGVLGDIGLSLLNLFPDSVKNAILNGFNAIRTALESLDLGFGDLAITILGIAALFVPGGQLVGVALLAFEAITVGIRALGGIADETWESIKNSAQNAWSSIKSGASDLWESIKIGLSEAWDSVVTFFTDALPTWWDETVSPWFTVEKWKELGQQAIDGLFEGLSNLWDDVTSWGDDLLSKVKDVLGIASPSKEFAEIGVYSVEGLAQGFDGMYVISEKFSTQLQVMLTSAQSFSASTKALINDVLATLQQALATAQDDNQTATDEMTLNYQTMAAQSNSAIQSIISYLNSIPRSITTIHTIITRYETEGEGGGSGTSSVSGFASGGFPDVGQLFLARESGPELVGTIGGQTAVVNNTQIVQGIASGVAEANMQQNALLREQNELLREILAKEGVTYLDGKQLYKAVEKAARNTGAVIMTGGVV